MARTWFVTGASRGIGAEIVQAALASGGRVIATARDATRIAPAVDSGRLLRLPLDVTIPAQIHAGVARALEAFGSIDVLVNNAGYGHIGAFEESSSEDIERQFATNVLGLLETTRAVLPAMRRQRAGTVVNLSSTSGIRGFPGGSLYCASKFAVEGFSESLALEVAEFGIRVVIVQPGPFRTDFLDPSSVRFASGSIPDYADLSERILATYQERNHRQAGDPSRLASAVLELVASNAPPLHFPAGSNALEALATKIRSVEAQAQAWQQLSHSTDGD